MPDEKKNLSNEILDMIEWLDIDMQSEYVKGMIAGLKVAQCIAEMYERLGGDTNEKTD